MLQCRSEVLLSLLLVSAFVASPAAKADDFYKGKTVTVTIGFTPGGGFDRNARTMALHLGKHIPGNPNVIPQNMPGAGSLTSVRALNATQAQDGTVINVFNPGFITRSVPSSIRTAAWPETTRPTCSTWQLSVPAVGPTCSDHFQPGS